MPNPQVPDGTKPTDEPTETLIFQSVGALIRAVLCLLRLFSVSPVSLPVLLLLLNGFYFFCSRIFLFINNVFLEGARCSLLQY